MTTPEPVYLDYAATTPLDPRVLEVMNPFFNAVFGNPSSTHAFGQRAEAAVETARERIASILNSDPGEIIFTSGGSESNNLALRGSALAARERRGAHRVLISAVEHHAVSHTAEQLKRGFGFQVEMIPVDSHGKVDPELVASRLGPDVALVSVILANNEIGTINPISEIGAHCRQLGILFHTDAVQAAAHLPVDVEEHQVDLMSLGAHKFYGPKGVGLLYVRRGTSLWPILTGGSQEKGLRAGTENVPYIVGMAEALSWAKGEQEPRNAKLVPLRDRIIKEVLTRIPDCRLTGHPVDRLPNHASFIFHHLDGNALLALLDIAGYACSSGSACKTGSPQPSEVLSALGLPDEWALGSLRVSLGSQTQEEHIGGFLEVLPDAVRRMREMAIP